MGSKIDHLTNALVLLLVVIYFSWFSSAVSVANEVGKLNLPAPQLDLPTLPTIETYTKDYPCEDLTDYACIRKYLSSNSQCSTHVTDFIPDEVVFNDVVFEMLFFNTSFTDQYRKASNMSNCYVSAFYVAVEKDVLVFSVDCPGLYFQANREVRQHRTYEVDDQFLFYIGGLYPRVRFTANIQHPDNMDFCNSFVFSDVTQLPTNLVIEPKDLATAFFLTNDTIEMNKYPATAERERFHSTGPNIFRIFVNSKLCDFGCN